MQKLSLLIMFAFAIVGIAQESVPPGFEHWNADSLKQIGQSLQSEAGANPQHISVRHLADYPNESYMLARRESDGSVEWHENQADIFFVQSGSATLVVGGKMIGGESSEPHEKRSQKIEGGTRQKLVPGDVVRIPARMPHQLLLEGSHDFTYFIVKVKGY